jgi:hypothetical protein
MEGSKLGAKTVETRMLQLELGLVAKSMVSNQKVLILYLLSRKRIWMYQSTWNYPLASIQLMFQILIVADTTSSLTKVCMDSSKQDSTGSKIYERDLSLKTLGMVHAWVGQTLLKNYIFKSILMPRS